MNRDSIAKRPLGPDAYKYGLFSLHSWIRCFECLIHIAHRIAFKTWQARCAEKKSCSSRAQTIYTLREIGTKRTTLLFERARSAAWRGTADHRKEYGSFAPNRRIAELTSQRCHAGSAGIAPSRNYTSHALNENKQTEKLLSSKIPQG